MAARACRRSTIGRRTWTAWPSSTRRSPACEPGALPPANDAPSLRRDLAGGGAIPACAASLEVAVERPGGDASDHFAVADGMGHHSAGGDDRLLTDVAPGEDGGVGAQVASRADPGRFHHSRIDGGQWSVADV